MLKQKFTRPGVKSAGGAKNLSGEQSKRVILKKLLKNLQKNLADISTLLNSEKEGVFDSTKENFRKAKELGRIEEGTGGKIIEGVFNGMEMVGPDGKIYSIPVNYASKSKLVEGDILKLTILPDGTFIYKQISPQKRARLRGTLIKDEGSREYYVLTEGKLYRVLTAAVTYFKAKTGDELIILVPESKMSKWAAIENIIQRVGGIPSTVLDEKIKELGLDQEEDLIFKDEVLTRDDDLEILKDSRNILEELTDYDS